MLDRIDDKMSYNTPTFVLILLLNLSKMTYVEILILANVLQLKLNFHSTKTAH